MANEICYQGWALVCWANDAPDSIVHAGAFPYVPMIFCDKDYAMAVAEAMRENGSKQGKNYRFEIQGVPIVSNVRRGIHLLGDTYEADRSEILI